MMALVKEASDHLDYNIFGAFSGKPIIEELMDEGKEKMLPIPFSSINKTSTNIKLNLDNNQQLLYIIN